MEIKKNRKFTYKNLAGLSDSEARKLLESIRWPDGPVCPHCGHTEYYVLKPRSDSKSACREGLYKCKHKECRKQYTVTVNTIFHRSHIKLGTWLAVIHLMCASKKGVSAHQVHRLFGVTYKTAFFMLHRVRFAMTQEPLAQKLTGIIECDETYVGGKNKRGKRGRGAEGKTPVFSLVERDGRIKSQSVANVTAKNLKSIIFANVDGNATICTDEFPSYKGLDFYFSGHDIVNHRSKEYVRGTVHTNTVEGYFSLLKRGINGTFHHVSPRLLNLYLNEFDFRYNNRKVTDYERTLALLQATEGKRLMYRDSSEASR